MIRNTIFNSSPIVIHAPSENPLWQTITKEFFSSHKRLLHAETPTITIITWNNRVNKGWFEKSLDRLCLDYTVLGKDISQEEWVNTDKIELTNAALQNINTEYTMGVDSFDAIITDNPEKTTNTLKQSTAELLFNATTGTQCSLPKHIEFFERTYKNEIYRHLNAGAWIGKTTFCKKFFAEVQSAYDYLRDFLPQPLVNSEQVCVKQAFMKMYPKVDIDNHCNIFQLVNDPVFCPQLDTAQGIEVLHRKIM